MEPKVKLTKAAIAAFALLLTPAAAQFITSSEAYAEVAERLLEQPLRVEYLYIRGGVVPFEAARIISEDDGIFTFEDTTPHSLISADENGVPIPLIHLGRYGTDYQGREAIEILNVSRITWLRHGRQYILIKSFPASNGLSVTVDSEAYSGQWLSDPDLVVRLRGKEPMLNPPWDFTEYLRHSQRALETTERGQAVRQADGTYVLPMVAVDAAFDAHEPDGHFVLDEWSDTLRSDPTRMSRRTFEEHVVVEGIALPGRTRFDIGGVRKNRSAYSMAENITVTPIAEAEWQAELERVRTAYFADRADASDPAAGQ